MRKLLIILLFIPFALSGQVQPIPADADYFVAPWGNDANSGLDTAHSWKTWQKAFETADVGDIVYFRGGVYYPTSYPYYAAGNICMIFPKQNSPTGHDGTAENPICYFNYPGETPILDGSLMDVSEGMGSNSGLVIYSADFLKFKGLTFRNIWQKQAGITAGGIMAWTCSNLTFENITVHDVGGRAFGYLSTIGQYTVATHPEDIYEIVYDTTRFINCDAYNIADSLATTPGNAGDGFKVDQEEEAYLYFEGCRTWNHSDDGLDISGRARVIVNNCWFFDAITQIGENNTEGNGFKFGMNRTTSGDGWEIDELRVSVTNSIVTNCNIGFDEAHTHFWQRDDIFNNFAYNNGGGFSVVTSAFAGDTLRDNIYRNNISYNNDRNSLIDGSKTLVMDHNTWRYCAGCMNWAEDNPDVTVSDADFVSLDATQLNDARQSDGSLPVVTFGRLAGTSDLIGAGTNVGMSVTPDMGIDWAYLDSGSEIPDPEVDYVATIYSNNASSVKSVTVTTGGNITSDGGATVTERGIVWGTSANPTTSNNKITTTGTTGSYSITISGLSGGTTYHVRSYAINSVGTSYGADVEFTTPAQSPVTGGTVIYQHGGINVTIP